VDASEQPGSGTGVVVGLGNPGPAYERTRHNVGFAVADELARRVQARFGVHKRSGADVAEGRLAGRKVVLAKPRSFMNVSGGPVAGVVQFFSVTVDDLLVVHDDLDLDLGLVRLKRGGGEGGHNGLRSITKSLGSKEYLRVRVGIGRPPGRMDPADFVLKPFTRAEAVEVDIVVQEAADAVELLLARSLVDAQNQVHPRP
jgi:PTH1 family peptidyl-tRNA hydrolase